SRNAEGLVLETGGATVRVVMRYWAMPLGRGWRWRFECPRCGTSRDGLHWRGEWGCRGKDCPDLEPGCRPQLRWCPAARRRAEACAVLTAGLESAHASSADCAAGSGDARKHETGEPRSDEEGEAL